MTYFHLECGEEGRPLKILGCFTAGWGPRLFNQAAPLSGVEKSRQQEMTTRAGQQPFSWGHLDLGTILGTYTGPVSCPETYREARATSSRLQERSRAQGNTRNGCLSWASSLPLLCAHPALWEYPHHSAHTQQGQFQEISPYAQRDSSGWACPLPPQYQRAMQTRWKLGIRSTSSEGQGCL